MNDIRSHLKALGQEHLLRFYDELDSSSQSRLIEQLKDLDYSVLDITDRQEQRGAFEPMGAMT